MGEVEKEEEPEGISLASQIRKWLFKLVIVLIFGGGP